MSSLEYSNPTTAGTEYSNIAKNSPKNLKTAFMNMIELFKEEMYKPLKEIYENQTGEGNKYK